MTDLQHNKRRLYRIMARSFNPQLVAELEKWCSETGVNPANALALRSVPADTSITNFEETVETVKVFG